MKPAEQTLPSAWIIVLNWNGLDLLKRCFDSIEKQTYRNLKCVMVDNGSTDGSVKFIEENYPWVEILETGKNLGFCRGNNFGMKLALASGADYIALLNNDVEVSPTWIEELVRAAEADPKVGIAASKMLMMERRNLLNSTGIYISEIGNGWDRGIGQLDGPSWNTSEEVLAASGGALFARAELFRKVGLFPWFEIYLEDVDLCMRTWNAGYKVIYQPSAVVYHSFSATMSAEGQKLRKVYLNSRNRLWLILRNFPVTKLIRKAPRLFWLEIRHIIGCLIKGLPAESWLEVRACIAALLYLPVAILYRLKALSKGYGQCRFWHLIQKDVEFFPGVVLPAVEKPAASADEEISERADTRAVP